MHETEVQVSESRQDTTPNATSVATRTRHATRQNAAFVSRHVAKCRICNHPDRHAIEFDFLNWRNPFDLVKAFHLRGLSTIYRHAHATGLFSKRRLNLRFALERIVERVNEVPVTANAVIRAARAISRINDSGEWVDPPSRVIVTHVHADMPSKDSPGGPGSQPVHDPAGTDEGFVGQGFSPDIKAGFARSSTSARQAGRGRAPGTAGRDASSGHGFLPRDGSRGSRAENNAPESNYLSRAPRASRVPRDTAASDSSTVLRNGASPIFDQFLLDEPSESASAAGEMPKINGKPAPPEIILELSPAFRQVREERARALEADRQASAAAKVRSGESSSSARQGGQQEGPPGPRQGEPGGSVPGIPASDASSEEISVASPPSSLPLARQGEQAAVPISAPSALMGQCPSPASNLEPPASRTAKQSPPSTGHGPRVTNPVPRTTPLGSTGSANPPFPFAPEMPRRWKPRRRF